MKIYKIIPFVLILQSSWAMLPEGIRKMRYGLNYSTAKKLWMGDKVKYFNDDGKTSFLSHSLEYAQGFPHNIQGQAHITYASVSMLQGNEGGTVEGDVRHGLSQISLSLNKHLFAKNKFNLTGYFGLKHPIHLGPSNDEKTSPDVFIAPNDGSFHTVIGITPSVALSPALELRSNLQYRFRSGTPKNQSSLDLFLSHFTNENLTLGIGYNLLRTWGGPDIGTPEFAEQVSLRSGNNSKIKAFSVVKESRDGVSALITYAPNPRYLIDAYYNRTIKGRNTDAADSLGAGIHYFF